MSFEDAAGWVKIVLDGGLGVISIALFYQLKSVVGELHRMAQNHEERITKLERPERKRRK